MKLNEDHHEFISALVVMVISLYCEYKYLDLSKWPGIITFQDFVFWIPVFNSICTFIFILGGYWIKIPRCEKQTEHIIKHTIGNHNERKKSDPRHSALYVHFGKQPKICIHY